MILNNRLIISGSVVARVQSLAWFFVEIRGYIEPGTKANCGTLYDAYTGAAASVVQLLWLFGNG